MERERERERGRKIVRDRREQIDCKDSKKEEIEERERGERERERRERERREREEKGREEILVRDKRDSVLERKRERIDRKIEKKE